MWRLMAECMTDSPCDAPFASDRRLLDLPHFCRHARAICSACPIEATVSLGTSSRLRDRQYNVKSRVETPAPYLPPARAAASVTRTSSSARLRCAIGSTLSATNCQHCVDTRCRGVRAGAMEILGKLAHLYRQVIGPSAFFCCCRCMAQDVSEVSRVRMHAVRADARLGADTAVGSLNCLMNDQSGSSHLLQIRCHAGSLGIAGLRQCGRSDADCRLMVIWRPAKDGAWPAASASSTHTHQC